MAWVGERFLLSWYLGGASEGVPPEPFNGKECL